MKFNESKSFHECTCMCRCRDRGEEEARREKEKPRTNEGRKKVNGWMDGWMNE